MEFLKFGLVPKPERDDCCFDDVLPGNAHRSARWDMRKPLVMQVFPAV